MVEYKKNEIEEEEDKKFKQEEFFYNSNSLTKEVVEYAKDYIDNFIKNVNSLESERSEAELCYKSFDRRIIALKNLFIKNVKDRENAYHLGIDFSKEDIGDTNNKSLNGKIMKEDIENIGDNDNKSNGNKIVKNAQDNTNEKNINMDNTIGEKNEEDIPNNNNNSNFNDVSINMENNRLFIT